MSIEEFIQLCIKGICMLPLLAALLTYRMKRQHDRSIRNSYNREN